MKIQNALKVKVVNKSKFALPLYQTPGSSGVDIKCDLSRLDITKLYDSYVSLKANLEAREITIKPGGRCLLPTGLFISLPEGYEAQIRPRSGLALKSGLTVLNAPGTIDADYRGNIGVIIINLNRIDVTITPGERIAQMVISKFEKANFIKVDSIEELNATDRGEGGFGHTGK